MSLKTISNMLPKKRVVIVGTGNVATHYAFFLWQQYELFQVVAIYGRQREHYQTMMAQIGACDIPFFSKFEDIPVDADFYIFCLSDDALLSCWQMMPPTKGLWIHTAGSVSVESMATVHQSAAVVYPLQSLNKSQLLLSKEVPVFLEVAREEDKENLTSFVELVFPLFYWADSNVRKMLHLSAVYVCNFVNHLYTLGFDILKPTGLPCDCLTPIIQHTANRILLANTSPQSLQTGPAERNDIQTMSSHRQILDNHLHSFLEIYNLLSQSILDRKNYMGDDYFNSEK